MTKEVIKTEINVNSHLLYFQHGGEEIEIEHNHSFETYVFILFFKFKEVFDIDKEVIKSKNRKREVSDLRKIFCYLVSLKFPSIKLVKIAEVLGYMGSKGEPDHASVIYSIRKCREFLETDREFKYKFNYFVSQLNK